MRELLAIRGREVAGLLDPVVLLSGGLVGWYCYHVVSSVDKQNNISARDAFLASVALAVFSVLATNRATSFDIAQRGRKDHEEEIARLTAQYEERHKLVLEQQEANLSRFVALASSHGMDALQAVSGLLDAVDMQRRTPATGDNDALNRVLDDLSLHILTAEAVVHSAYRNYSVLESGTTGLTPEETIERAEKLLRARKAVSQERLDALRQGDTARRALAEQALATSEGVIQGTDVWRSGSRDYVKDKP
jgi:hypothetical protein